MLKKMFAATTALIMIFSSFAVSYAEEAAEKQYIVRLKTSDVQLMNADGSRHFFDIADESTLDELLREDLVEWYEEDYSVELFDESEQNTEKLPEEPVPTEEHIKKYDESKWDFPTYRLSHVFTTSETQGHTVHNFYAGLKLTILYGISAKERCIICGSHGSERDFGNPFR